ncbi:MAG: glycosyltransferase family 2 protein [Patescibacteria group bacterium]
MSGIKELSVIIPIYNEESTIKEIIDRVLALPIDLEIIIVNDGSFDATGDILLPYQNNPLMRIINRKENQGKGKAIRDALICAKGEYIVIQDADLEYEPADLVKLLRKAQSQNLPVIYGSRFLNKKRPAGMRLSFILANHFFTWLTNLLYGSHLTDEGTCYKMFKREVICSLNLKANGFEFCPEATAKALKAGYKIAEVPIRYQARYINKKVKFRDSFIIIWTLLKYYFKPNKT